MTKQERYAWQGNFRLGYPELYWSTTSSIEQFEEKNEEIRAAVREDFPFRELYKIVDDKDNLKWNYLSVWVKLTEDELREFQDYIKWDLIKKYHKNFSENFKREFADRL